MSIDLHKVKCTSYVAYTDVGEPRERYIDFIEKLNKSFETNYIPNTMYIQTLAMRGRTSNLHHPIIIHQRDPLPTIRYRCSDEKIHAPTTYNE